jgi:hypothetical protein
MTQAVVPAERTGRAAAPDSPRRRLIPHGDAGSRHPAAAYDRRLGPDSQQRPHHAASGVLQQDDVRARRAVIPGQDREPGAPASQQKQPQPGVDGLLGRGVFEQAVRQRIQVALLAPAEVSQRLNADTGLCVRR